jgi:Zn-dependent protease with chaperone function
VITLFRPAITLLLLALVALVFFQVTQTEQAGMINEIQFAAFNAIGWWFGDRMAVRMKKS